VEPTIGAFAIIKNTFSDRSFVQLTCFYHSAFRDPIPWIPSHRNQRQYAIAPTLHSYQDCRERNAGDCPFSIFCSHRVSEVTFDQFQERGVNMAASLARVHLPCCDKLFPCLRVNPLGNRTRRNNEFSSRCSLGRGRERLQGGTYRKGVMSLTFHFYNGIFRTIKGYQGKGTREVGPEILSSGRWSTSGI
jgi:hypothetical protein